MLCVALDYHSVINDITGNKVLKLCQYELDDGDWAIVKDLSKVLKVHVAVLHLYCMTSFHCHSRCTKMPHYFSPKMMLSLLLMLCQQWTGST